jgi:epoxyqueuosine reductase
LTPPRAPPKMACMDDRAARSHDLKEYILGLGITLVGLADIRQARRAFLLDRETASRFDTAVAMGLRLADGVLEDIRSQPTPLYFHHYRQANSFLDRAALRTALWIQDKGFQALPIAASQIIDWDKQLAHVSHKKIGLLAGLGWTGRNNLLVNPEHGARFRLVTVLTDMPLAVDSPLVGDCGSCRECIAVCPAGAIKDSVENFDHLACYEKLKEFRRRGLVSQFICGVCVKACAGRSSGIR